MTARRTSSASRNWPWPALTHVYRTRYSYMNHWEAIRQSWIEQLAKEFDAADVVRIEAASKPPWKVETPVSARRDGATFREDLAVLPAAERPGAGRSPKDLVPAGLQVGQLRPPRTSSTRTERRYALFSRRGRAAGADHHDGHHRLVSRSAGGELRGDGRRRARKSPGAACRRTAKEHPLTARRAAAGLVLVRVQRSGGRPGASRVAAGRPVAVALSRSSPPAHLGHMQRMYFFVPRGHAEDRVLLERRPARRSTGRTELVRAEVTPAASS